MELFSIRIQRTFQLVSTVVAQHGVLPCLQERFCSAVGKDCREKVIRQDVMIVPVEAVAFQFGDETLSGIGTHRCYIVCVKPVILAHFHVAVFRPLVVIQH